VVVGMYQYSEHTGSDRRGGNGRSSRHQGWFDAGRRQD
jgi:hypothetical protein